MLLQQRAKLICKTHLFMMRFLILYIPYHRWNIRRAHAKRPIPFLPLNLVRSFVCPPRRIGLDRCNGFGQRQTRWGLNQQMNVVVHPSDRKGKNPLPFANARYISPQLRTKVCRNAGAPLLRAEHNMNHVLRISVDMCRNSGARDIYILPAHPALTRWANFWHAYGVSD